MKWTRPRALLLAILLLYVVLATLYAVYTPRWQAPDEPAHYNYIRYVAQTGTFPVLHMGDYPHAYLEQIKAARFPSNMSINSIRYEYHQPPLYYALAAIVFSVTWGALLPLRLLSVFLGIGIVLLAYLIVRRVFPDWPALALGTAAFVAFVPQHLATVAQVGNDVFAELLLALAFLMLVTWLTEADNGAALDDRVRVASPATDQPAVQGSNPLRIVALGVVVGLILITKTTAYIAAPLALGVVLWDGWRRRVPLVQAGLNALLFGIPALLLALPWYLRDIDVYGWPDFLGLRTHDNVVVGQLRTADFLAQQGWGAYLERLVTFTFKSFWGVFGWLGVFMDSRVYTGLALMCLVVAGGLLLHEGQVRRAGALRPGQRYALRLLAISALLTLLTYAGYNMQFVQHQGRYLFTALIPVAIAFGLGWHEALMSARNARLVASLLVLAAAAVAIWGSVVAHALPKWPVALALAGALLLALRPFVPRRLDGLLFSLPYVALPLLALYALFGAIVPQLAR
jgi:4-amino-4-deoxy-L-arabinose transferase-like glycosyltransferase